MTIQQNLKIIILLKTNCLNNYKTNKIKILKRKYQLLRHLNRKPLIVSQIGSNLIHNSSKNFKLRQTLNLMNIYIRKKNYKI